MNPLEKHFSEFLEYMKRYRRAPTSIRTYKNTFNLFIKDGHSIVDTESVEKFLAERYSNPATWNKALNHLRSFAKWAGRKGPGYLGVTAGALMVESQEIQVDLPITVQDDSADKWLAALKERNRYAWAFIVIQHNTGMRFSEVHKLRRESYYEPEPGSRNVKFRGKGGVQRIVPLNDDAYEAFCIWRRQDERPGGYLHANSIRYHLTMAAKEAGIPHIKTHWLRHTVASKLDQKNVPYERIADLLGNSVEVVRTRYRRMNHTKLGELVRMI